MPKNHPSTGRVEAGKGAPLLSLPPAIPLLLSRLADAGHEGWLVGGCVRDALRGVTPHDYDITTSATPEQMHRIFADHRRIDTGAAHGTLTVLVEGAPYELTTYRIDGEYRDSRHPTEVRFTPDLTLDLSRRDFTMNAIAYHPARGIVDPFGGAEDIAAGRIRAVGEPARRFEEDALRILRALRFSSVLGFSIEGETAAAARMAAQGLLRISAERVREELTKLLLGEYVGAVLSAYADVLAVRLPEWGAALTVNGEYDAQRVSRVGRVLSALPPSVPLRYTALFLPMIGQPGAEAEVDGLLARLRFDRRTRERICKLLRHVDTPYTGEERVLRRFLASLGEEDAYLLLSLHAAVADAEGNAERLAALEEVRARLAVLCREGALCSVADLAVGGRELLAIGFREGKELGELLHRLYHAVLDGSIPNEKEALLAYARAYRGQ